jgi:uncharacterized UPF0146 family protein
MTGATAKLSEIVREEVIKGDSELYDDIRDPSIASEIFEQAHFLYSTRSVEETVCVMVKLGMARTASLALGESARYKFREF